MGFTQDIGALAVVPSLRSLSQQSMSPSARFFQPALSGQSIYHSSQPSHLLWPSFFGSFKPFKQAAYLSSDSEDLSQSRKKREAEKDRKDKDKKPEDQGKTRKAKSKGSDKAESGSDRNASDWLQQFLAGKKTPLPPKAYLPSALSALLALALTRYSDMPRRLPSGLFYSFHDPQYRYVYGTGHDFYRPGAPLPEIEGVGRLFAISSHLGYNPELKAVEISDPAYSYNVQDLKDALLRLRNKLEETPDQSHLPVHVLLSGHGYPGYITGSPSIAHFVRDFQKVFPDPSKVNIGSLSVGSCFAGTCLDDLEALEKEDPELALGLQRHFDPWDAYLYKSNEHPFTLLSKKYGFPIYTNRGNYGFFEPVYPIKASDRHFPLDLSDSETLRKIFGPDPSAQDVDYLHKRVIDNNDVLIAMGNGYHSLYQGKPTLRVFSPSGDKVFHSDREMSDFLSQYIAPSLISVSSSEDPAYADPRAPTYSWEHFPYTVSDWRKFLETGYRVGFDDPKTAPWYSPGKIGEFTHSYHPYFSTSALVAAPLVASAFKDPKSRVAASTLTSAALSLPSLYSLALQALAFSAKSRHNVEVGSSAGTTSHIASGALRELGPMAFFALSPLAASTLMLYLSGDLQKALKSRSRQKSDHSPNSESKEQGGRKEQVSHQEKRPASPSRSSSKTDSASDRFVVPNTILSDSELPRSRSGVVGVSR